MKDNFNKTTGDFLKSIHMHPDMTDIGKTTEIFLSDMKKGLIGESSSLKMIPTYISVRSLQSENKPVIAIDAGGTNLRIALVTFNNGIPNVLKLEKYSMPGSQGEITSEEFFEGLADKVLPFTDETHIIGFCFSYPAEIFPDCDGRILCLTKEVNVKNAEGKIIGKELINKLQEKGAKKEFKLVVLNDTVASLMGGVASLDLSDCNGLSGLILGTGNNTCYAEKGERIKKLHLAKDMIINCESGNFSGAFRGESDRMTDAESENPGTYLFEKMLGGVYHGKVITNTSILASKEGLLSRHFSNICPMFTTPELDDFLRGTQNRITLMCQDNDAEVLKLIIDMSFERAAKLVCANIAAICLQCDGGKSTELPFCVFAEGSTFYKSLLFREKLDKYVKSHIEDRLNRFVVFKRAENLTLIGAAYSALTN